MRLISLTLCAIASILAAACTTDVAGDPAFVRQAIEKMLGRKPLGSAEIRALHQVLQDAGGDRGVVLQALAARPEYLEYWTLRLADALQVRREGSLAQRRDCYGAPLLADATSTLALAEHIATQPPTVSFGAPWNMTDALRAAILSDDLSVAYLAYLPAVAGAVEVNADEVDAAAQFGDVFLGRSPGCVACHSSSYSKSGAETGWDRHAPPLFALEASIYRGSSGPLAFPIGSSVPQQLIDGDALYVSAGCSGCHDGAAMGTQIMYWDQDGDASTPDSELTLATRVPVLTDAEIRGVLEKGPGAMPSFSFSDSELEALLVALRLRLGGHEDVREFFRNETVDPPGINPWGMDAACQADVAAAPLALLTERQVGFAGRHNGSPDALDLVTRLQSGMAALPAALEDPPARVAPVELPLLDGESAYAYLLARRAADAFAKHLVGRRLGLAHGFSRNEDQEELRDGIARRMVAFDPATGRTRLSLRNAFGVVLESGVPSAPIDATLLDPWPWPMILDALVAEDPRAPSPVIPPGADANGPGDVVHRHDAVTLLYAVHGSLGWNAPALFPRRAFPDADLVANLGGFRGADRPGFDDWDLQSLVHWEAEVGACRSPGGAPDWIDDLMLQATLDTDLPALTAEDLFAAVRDRLLGTSVFAPDERETVEAIVFVPPSTQTLASTPFPRMGGPAQAALEDALRGYCGALLVSPQYTMAGLTTETLLPPAARLVACLGGSVPERCTEAELYEDYLELAGP